MNCDPSKKKQRNTGNQKVVSAKPGKMWLTTSKQNHQIYQKQEPLTQNANKQNCIFRNCRPTTSNANSASNLHNHAFFQSHRIVPCFFSVVSGKLQYIINHFSTYTTEPQPTKKGSRKDRFFSATTIWSAQIHLNTTTA